MVWQQSGRGNSYRSGVGGTHGVEEDALPPDESWLFAQAILGKRFHDSF